MTDVFKGDATWLGSDGQIIARAAQSAHKKGIQLILTMPDGTDLLAVVPKVDGPNIIKYCEFVRGAYIEQQAEQKAKKARAAAERQMADDDAAAAADVPDVKETVGFDILNAEDVAERCLSLASKEESHRWSAAECKRERETLLKVSKVLRDAQEDSAETPASIERETEDETNRYIPPTFDEETVDNFKKAIGEEE